MGLSINTYLVIGVRLPNIPEEIMEEYWADEKIFFDKNTKIEIHSINCYEDSDKVVGFVVGKLKEMDDIVVEKELSFIEDFAFLVENLIKKKIDIGNQKARLLFFHQAS